MAAGDCYILFVPAVGLSAVGRRTFPVAGACIGLLNDLPSHITSSPSQLTLTRLKIHLLRLSYPGLTV